MIPTSRKKNRVRVINDVFRCWSGYSANEGKKTRHLVGFIPKENGRSPEPNIILFQPLRSRTESAAVTQKQQTARSQSRQFPTPEGEPFAPRRSLSFFSILFQKKVKSESPRSLLSVQRSYSLLSRRGDRDRGRGDLLLFLIGRLLALLERLRSA